MLKAVAFATFAAAALSTAASGRGAATPGESVPPPDAERRFEIVRVSDSTVSLLAPHERWVRAGAYGIAVDPRQRDVLVARLRVLSRSADTAVALITGQTTRLTTDYVAIFRRPATPVLRERAFWGGVAAGLLAAAAALLLVRTR